MWKGPSKRKPSLKQIDENFSFHKTDAIVYILGMFVIQFKLRSYSLAILHLLGNVRYIKCFVHLEVDSNLSSTAFYC